MRILVLTKRHTSGKDLLDHRYGRVYELTQGLAKLGHEVTGIAIGYRNEKKLSKTTVVKRDIAVQWHSLNLDWVRPWRTLLAINRFVDQHHPDILWCSGDALQVIAGVQAANHHTIPVVSDLYDNYEAFSITRLPGIRKLFRSAVRKSDGVTCVSDPLRLFVQQVYQRSGPTKTIVNGANLEQFHCLDRAEARKFFDIPKNAIIVGTAGSLRRRRGLKTLMKAFHTVQMKYPKARLLLAGPTDHTSPHPSGKGVIYLGHLHHKEMPAFLKSLDVGIIMIRNDAFGKYCYPLKLPEMVAAGIPFIAARVGQIPDTPYVDEDCLFDPSDSRDLAVKLLAQIETARPTSHPAAHWNDLARKLESFLQQIKNY